MELAPPGLSLPLSKIPINTCGIMRSDFVSVSKLSRSCRRITGGMKPSIAIKGHVNSSTDHST